MTPEEAEKLRQEGHISDSLFQRIVKGGMKLFNGTDKSVEEHPLTKKLDDKLKEVQANPTVDKANKATEAGLQKARDVLGGWTQRTGEKIADAVTSPEQKSARLERQIADAKRQIDDNKKAMEPKDIGDIDSDVREPVQMERSFSNEEDKAEYLKNKLKEKK